MPNDLHRGAVLAVVTMEPDKVVVVALKIAELGLDIQEERESKEGEGRGVRNNKRLTER